MELKFLLFYSLILLQKKAYSALTIEECPDGMKNVKEDSEIRLTCAWYDRKIEWYYSSDNTLGDKIGDCDRTSCYPTDRNQFRLDAERSWGSYKSTLDITRVTRDEARFFGCKNSNDIASCRLQVTAPAEVVPENCRVWISDWKVQGECLVEKMYSSDDVDIYKCTWNANNTQVTGVFQSPLSPYQTDGRGYMRGVCSLKQQIPFNGYSFNRRISYIYKISIDPGSQNIIVATITIEPPKKPEINCSGIVLEGSTVICNCTSQNRGNPPAKFVWDGTNTDRLLLHNVSRQQSSTSYTCRQTWDPYGVINRTVNYNFTVAYGPLDVNISIVISDNGSKSFKCTAKDVFPSAMFRWSIFCDKKTDTWNTSTCKLTTRDTDDDIVVQCTASNTAFPDSSVTKIFVGDYASTTTEISSSGTEQRTTQANEQNAQSMDSSSSDTNNGGLIGGVVAAVIFAIIVGAVIAVIIVKRRKDFNSERFSMKLWPCAFKFFHKKSPPPTPYATVNKPTSATPIKRLAAPSGDLYTRPASTNSVDYNGEYVTVSDTVENNVDGMIKNFTLMTNQSKHETTDLKETAKRTINPKPMTAATNNCQDNIGSVYMNVTEVPTDSGLGVYHIVPWRTMPTQETDTRNDGAPAAVSEDEYNALNFEEDRSGQEDQAATYHHLEHE